MTNTVVELQAKMYVFDLANCAKEFWFKDDEGWDLCLASRERKAELERRYYPTMATKGLPETLVALHSLVKTRLHTVNTQARNGEASEEMSSDPEFLIAFNRGRLR